MQVNSKTTLASALAIWAVAVAALDGEQIVLAGTDAPPKPEPARPNIILILTDDQDLHMNSLDHTPLIQKHLVKEGTFYKRHFCTTAICCPSRASLWTGKLAHNTNVTDLNPPYGGFPIFVKNGHNEDYLPVWLQNAGYNTFYTGKMLNAHSVWNYGSPHLKGWTGSDFLLDPNTYDYWNATFQRNHEAPVNHLGEYSTDLVAKKALGFLSDAAAADKPFFLGIAPIAPHTNINSTVLAKGARSSASDGVVPDRVVRHTIPKPAKRHEHLFPGAKVPRTDNFNPDYPSGAGWVRKQPKLKDEYVEYNDRHYQGRLQALQAVDELVDNLFKRLEEYDLLDNTYIFYTSDNGYHIGQHRLQPGKECGYEEDVNVPLVVRGPGIAKGEIAEVVTAHVDLAPTFLTLTGADLGNDLDGIPIPLSNPELIASSDPAASREHVNVEFWGSASSESNWGLNGGKDWTVPNNTYKSLRVIGTEYNLYYSVWCTDEHELYDMRTDPGQLVNLLHPDESETKKQSTILGLPLDKVIPRLDALLFVLKSCKGSSCSQPWKSLHPQGNVNSLRDALSPQYDAFYEKQVKIRFNYCDVGYIIPAEGPQFEDEGNAYWKGTSWSDWT